MIAHACSLSLSLSLLVSAVGASVAISLDAANTDSIKSAAKTLASALVDSYNSQPNGTAPGLWNEPYLWWESGTVWGGLVDYSHLTGDTQFDEVVAKALWAQRGEDNMPNFMPANQTTTITNSGQSIWALAALTAEEVGFNKPEKGAWIDLAKNAFENFVLRWEGDNTCGGGLRFGISDDADGSTYKHAASNSNFFLLSARLARFTGNTTYAVWAEKSYTWMRSAELISDKYNVYDGFGANYCDEPDHFQTLETYAAVTEGVAVMYNLTNGNETWKSHVEGFLGNLPRFQANKTSILTEFCEVSGMGCHPEYRTFKGLAARALARTTLSAPFAAEAPRKVLEASAKGAAKSCVTYGKLVACREKWYEVSSSNTTTGGLRETFSALEAVQALLYQSKGVLKANATADSTNPKPSGAGSPQATPTGAAGHTKVALGGVALAGMLAVLL